MNEELKKMLDSINAKKQEVKDLCKAGKIEDAATAKEELKKLQAQFDLVYDLDVTKTEGMGEKAAAGAAKTIADKAKNIAGAFVNAIKAEHTIKTTTDVQQTAAQSAAEETKTYTQAEIEKMSRENIIALGTKLGYTMTTTASDEKSAVVADFMAQQTAAQNK